MMLIFGDNEVQKATVTIYTFCMSNFVYPRVKFIMSLHCCKDTRIFFFSFVYNLIDFLERTVTCVYFLKFLRVKSTSYMFFCKYFSFVDGYMLTLITVSRTNLKNFPPPFLVVFSLIWSKWDIVTLSFNVNLKVLFFILF